MLFDLKYDQSYGISNEFVISKSKSLKYPSALNQFLATSPKSRLYTSVMKRRTFYLNKCYFVKTDISIKLRNFAIKILTADSSFIINNTNVGSFKSIQII
jgi:hypothetical protein